MREMLANVFFRARKQDALRGIMRDEGVNRGGVGGACAAGSHDFDSCAARRSRASMSDLRTAPGAVPPEAARRASEESRVSVLEKSAPNAEEYIFSFSTGHAA